AVAARAVEIGLLAAKILQHAMNVGPDRGAVVVFAAAFKPSEQVKLQVAGLEQVGAGEWRDLLVVQRMHQNRRDENHQFLLAGVKLVKAEGTPDDRDVADEWHAGGLGSQ